MTKSRDRDRRPARRAVPIEPKRRLLIVGEGEVTERQYFEEFRKACRNPRVTVKYKGPAGSPMKLVGWAKELKEQAEDEASRQEDDNLLYDQVWCVFDVDIHPKVPEARAMAKENGLCVAMSNPCFELWLLLHFRDSPGIQHRHDVQSMWSKEMGREGKHIDFAKLKDRYPDAVRRAEKLKKDAEDGGEKPWKAAMTEVHHLTDSIDEEKTMRPISAPRSQDDEGRRKAQEAANHWQEIASQQQADDEKKDGES